MTNKKSHMLFRLTPRSMTLDDPDLLMGGLDIKYIFFSNFYCAM